MFNVYNRECYIQSLGKTDFLHWKNWNKTLYFIIYSQGGVRASRVTMTAYVLLALLEFKDNAKLGVKYKYAL